MATLYELTGKYKKLLEYADDLDPTVYHDTMDSITDDVDVKANEYNKVIKDFDQKISELNGKIAPFLNEVERLQKRVKTIQNKKKLLKDNLKTAMETTGITNIHTESSTLYIHTSKSVEIEDEHKLPAYLFKETRVPNKSEIGKQLREGKDVPGAKLHTSTSLGMR